MIDAAKKDVESVPAANRPENDNSH